MSAQERLAAALEARAAIECPLPLSGLFDPGDLMPGLSSGADLAAAILAADPNLAQDIEDGAALRRLREAAEVPATASVACNSTDAGWRVDVWDDALYYDNPDDAHLTWATGSTIAAAADKAREAIEAGR